MGMGSRQSASRDCCHVTCRILKFSLRLRWTINDANKPKTHCIFDPGTLNSTSHGWGYFSGYSALTVMFTDEVQICTVI